MPSLFDRFVHLGPGATATVQPPFDGLDWYRGYGERHDRDGADGRLVSLYRFDADWQSWEMHPAGEELVVCVAGTMTVHQERPDGGIDSVTLGVGDYAINPAGVWHTADVAGEATALFVTPGLGTEHRPR